MHRALLSLLLAASPALAGEKLLSVLELHNKLDGPDRKAVDPGYVSDRIRASVLDEKLGIQVMTRENMLVLLQSQGKTLEGCEGECEVDTGRRLGADYVISGEVLRVGAQLKASLKLHDTHSGTLIGAISASGVDVDALDTSIPAAVSRLTAALRLPVPPQVSTGAPPPAAPRPVSQGIVTMSIPAPDAEKWMLVAKDGSVLCQLPCKQRLDRGSSYYAERDADRAADRTRIAVPHPSSFAPGRSADAVFVPGRAGGQAGFWLIALGLAAGSLAAGAISVEHDTYCYPNGDCLDAKDPAHAGTPTTRVSPNPTLTRGLLAGGAVTAVVGIVLAIRGRDEHYEAVLAGGQARVHLAPNALAINF
jgi:TolB-like protein